MYMYMYPCTCLLADSVRVVGLFECRLCFVSSSECLFSRLDLCSLVFSLPAISHFPKPRLMQLQPLFINIETKYWVWGAFDNECTCMHNPPDHVSWMALSASVLSFYVYPLLTCACILV